MTTANLAETILRDVPRYQTLSGNMLPEDAVLAALTAAMDPALSERAGEVLSRLRKADEYEPLGHDGWEAADLITALLAETILRDVTRYSIDWPSDQYSQSTMIPEIEGVTAVTVGVKPLSWAKNGSVWTAKTSIGDYHVMIAQGDWVWTCAWQVVKVSGNSEASAKAAAQADYEVRILAALEPAALTTEADNG